VKRAALTLAFALALAACGPSNAPQTGSQTNWLVACDSSADCGGLECWCGTCTAPCDGDAACAELGGASCVPADDAGSIALCGGQTAPSALCLDRCDADSCPAGSSCVAGVCAPSVAATVQVTIDRATRHQTLVGFGAALVFTDDDIVAHPQKVALYDLLFAESGLDVLRLHDRYEGSSAALAAASEIVTAASERLGHAPVVLITSGSPPAALKANASRLCAGDLAACTLVKLPGGFDYEGFASFWRASLEAYASVGVAPDYLSIQNNPNWVPPAETPQEACRFLPVEGMTTIEVDGAPVDVEYPGYREALAAVRAAIADLPAVPRITAPDVSSAASLGEFVPPLAASELDVLALHLYDMDESVDVAALENVRALAAQLDRPVFQSEMQAGGLETAILAHHALEAAGASSYLQNDLVSLTEGTAPVALVHLTEDAFEAQGPYHALAHYAKSTDPGWVRVDSTSTQAELLASAWLSPDERSLTVVLVNSGLGDHQVELGMGEFVSSQVTRTVFDGIERSAVIGALASDRIVRVPGRSIVTVALASD
jgi:glucuronoarabinoxylan endo-1,4-beta-xylanase